MAPSKTRLLICTTSRSIYGGVENIIADLCNNLPKHGIYPILGLVKGSRFNDPDRYRAAFPNLSTVDIDGTKGTRQARIEGLLKTIKHVRPDIVLIARVFDAYHAVSIIKKMSSFGINCLLLYPIGISIRSVLCNSTVI